MIIKKSKDISIEDLEKIIKVSGDKIVSGYIRFKKVKPVKGYQEARKRAAAHLSKITKARPLGNNQYAVVVRLYLIIFLIPLVLLALIFLILQMSTKAVEKEFPEYILTQEATIKETESYMGMYMSVPGFTGVDTSCDNPQISVYNPVNNQCKLMFEVYYGDSKIGESSRIIPGEEENVFLSKVSHAGIYDIQIIARGYSMDGETAYNSVSQQIKLNVF